ncbi:MAG: STAS domain-containing protein [Spirochaetia bacterium]|nr:STAS domain-containing protein [Spirochaetia bacterium]
MSIEIKQAETEDYGLLQIKGDMSIYNVLLIKEQFNDAINSHDNLVFDLSGVNEIDTAGFQMLVLAKQEAARQNKALKIINHSGPVLKIFDLFGAVGFFGDKIKLPKNERDNYSFSYGIKKQKVPI